MTRSPRPSPSSKAKGLIYEGRLPPPKGKIDEEWENREQLLFRSTEFGDDQDRPLVKSDGGYTYFASDIAYHRDKFRRGFRSMIDVWGADHSGHVKRMQSALAALTERRGPSRHQDLSAGALVSGRRACQNVQACRNVRHASRRGG